MVMVQTKPWRSGGKQVSIPNLLLLNTGDKETIDEKICRWFPEMVDGFL